MSFSAGGVAEGVSRETRARLEAYLDLLEAWNKKINLVSPASIKDGWRRHIVDSLQLTRHAPVDTTWVDLGAGAGLPGLIVSALQCERGGSMTLVESDARKCAFMREAARKIGASAEIINARIEDFTPANRYAVVTSRALAPLEKLLAYAEPLVAPGAICLFPKGANASAELTAAEERWTMDVDELPSETAPDAAILRIREFARRARD